MIFVRHCQSSGQAPDAPLTPQGAADARALTDRLLQLGIDAVYSSPYLRAVQTIEPFAAKHALPINIEFDMRERRLSAEPLDDWLDHIRQSFANLDHRAPGGETLREAQSRGLAALQRIHMQRPACAVVASHGNLLASLLHRMDPSFGFEAWQTMPNPALYRVALTAGVPTSFEVLV
ncbi:MAG: histidine phosphatase family protein [Alphaproteobacteria bacterium]|nr:histidine phosphatase family protein [Alphaproteobacteria bacterium]